MSRKRKQRSKAQAVPEEVLAEGSGPVGPAPEVQADSPDVIVESTEDSFEETIQPAAAELPEAASDEGAIDEAIGDAIEDPVDDAVEPMQMVADEITEELPEDSLDDPPDETSPDVSDGTIEVVDLVDPGDTPEEQAATLPTSAASMDAAQLKLLVEALVFASDKPITVARLRQLTRVSDTKRLEQALAELTQDYGSRGLVLQQVSGGYQFRTRSQFSGWVQQLIAGRPVRLSRAQLETLAIIAYRQPITRPEIDDIRGVDSSGTLKVLIDRALIRILGKKEEVGRPMLYGTTKEFLDFFSLGDLRELPTLREYSELTDESRRVMTDRLGLPPDGDPRGGEGEGGASGDGGGSMPPPTDGGQGGEPLGASADDELQVPDVELAAASASFEAVAASDAVEADGGDAEDGAIAASDADAVAAEADADADAAADADAVAASDAAADADGDAVEDINAGAVAATAVTAEATDAGIDAADADPAGAADADPTFEAVASAAAAGDVAATLDAVAGGEAVSTFDATGAGVATSGASDSVDSDSPQASAELDAMDETVSDGTAMLADSPDDADALHAGAGDAVRADGADADAMGFVDEETLSGTTEGTTEGTTDGAANDDANDDASDGNDDSTPRMRARTDAHGRGPHLAEGSGPMMTGAHEDVSDDEAPAAGDDLSPELLRATVEPADDPSADPTRD